MNFNDGMHPLVEVRAIQNKDRFMRKFTNPETKSVFDGYTPQMQKKLLRLRELVFETADETSGVGPLEEVLKWGQPSYLTSESKSGTTIRIDQVKGSTDKYGLYVHCQTTLLRTYRDIFGDELNYDGNRCIWFRTDETLNENAVRQCISLALTYHRDKAS